MEIVGLILAGLAVFGSIFTSIRNYTSQNATNELQERLANQANVWQRENRDYENWYNSPTGLSQRGLNPYLAMSAGGGSLAQSVSAGSANLPSDLKAPQLPDFGSQLAGVGSTTISNLNQTRQTDSQIELNDAAAESYRAEAARKTGLLPYEKEQLSTSAEVNKSVTALNTSRIAEVLSNIGVNRAKASELQQITEHWRLQNRFDSDTFDSRVSMILNQKTISDNDVKYCEKFALQHLAESRSLIDKYTQEAEQALADANLAPERREQIMAAKEQLYASARHLDSLKDNVEESTRKLEQENGLLRKYGDKEHKAQLRRTTQQTISGYVSTYNETRKTTMDGVKIISDLVPKKPK